MNFPGYVPLCEAADIVGQRIIGAQWRPIANADVAWLCEAISEPEIERVISLIAEGCERGEIGAAYRSITGVDDLERTVWRAPHWWTYFIGGTINLDLPLLEGGRPAASGFTTRCTREIFIRKDDLARLVAKLEAPTEPASREHRHRHHTDAELIEEGRRLCANGMSKRAAARQLAPQAEGGDLDQRAERLRKLI